MRFAGQGLITQPVHDGDLESRITLGGPVHQWPNMGPLGPVHQYPTGPVGPVHERHTTMDFYKGKPLPWDRTPSVFERKPYPHYRGTDHPGLETMEIKPGWKPSPPQSMEIRY